MLLSLQLLWFYCVSFLFTSGTDVRSLDNILRDLNVTLNKSFSEMPTKFEDVFALYQFFNLTAAAKHWQYSFQTPHNDSMFWIIDLHADIMVFLVFVLGLIFMLLVSIISPLNKTKTTPIAAVVSQTTYSDLEHVDLKLHSHNTFYEMIWTVVPILLEFFIILPSFIVHYAVSQTHPYYLESKGITNANTIRIIGNQWYWVYQYISRENLTDVSVATTIPVTVIESYLITPSETPTGFGFRLLEVDMPLKVFAGNYYKLLITSDDVIHSWAVPSLNVKVDACPGRLSELALQFKDHGIFYGQCSEICGYYHGNMPIVVVAE